MWFVFTIPLISVLQMFQPVTSYSCDQADWSVSLDRATWSKCPRTNTYLRGLWRNDRQWGDERVRRIEYGKCRPASEPSYANRPATCSNANWLHTLDGVIRELEGQLEYEREKREKLEAQMDKLQAQIHTLTLQLEDERGRHVTATEFQRSSSTSQQTALQRKKKKGKRLDTTTKGNFCQKRRL